jgi:hypothetical protein
MTTGTPAYLAIKGERWQSIPVVEVEDDEYKLAQLDAFLQAVPRDASHAGVALDNRGNLDFDDMRQILPSMVYLQFPLQQIHDYPYIQAKTEECPQTNLVSPPQFNSSVSPHPRLIKGQYNCPPAHKQFRQSCGP